MKTKIIILTMFIIIFGACKLNSTQGDDAFVKVSNIDNTKDFKGYIKQRPLNKLYFQTDGKISFMPYKKGDFVRKGQVLARLDAIAYKIKKDDFKLNNEINYNIITAPYDAYIEEIYNPVNSYIRKNEAVLSIYPYNKTRAETMVSAEFINKINLKQNVLIEYKDCSYEAKISNISKNEDNYMLELELNNLYKELKEGSSVDIKLKLSP